MHHHAWIIEVLSDIATYSERNRLTELHIRLCTLLAMLVDTGATQDAGGALPGLSEFSNVVKFSDYDPR